jgi:hypothetical protein
VTWLVDGAATYAALLDAIAQARDHVHLEYYIFNPDHAGTALRDALVERARPACRCACCWMRWALPPCPAASCSRCWTPAARRSGSIRGSC